MIFCKGTDFGALLVENPRPGKAQQWPLWVLAGQAWRQAWCWLVVDRDMGVLATDGDMCVHPVGAGEQWSHGCVLGGCW